LKFRVIEREGCGMGVASGVEAMPARFLLAGLASVLALTDTQFR
jgi:hypothetical protein